MILRFSIPLLCLLIVPRLAWGQADPAADEAAITETGKAYVAAFNARDADSLAKFWAPEAVYTNRLTGQQVTGRDAIAQQFKNIFTASDDLKLGIQVDSIQFVSPNVAVEHGLAQFASGDSKPEQIDYSAVYVRRGGKWLLDRVTDDPRPEVQSNYEHLKELEWLIGDWVDEDENARIVTECNWAKNNNFMTRSFTVEIDDRVDMSGMQIVGWNPINKQICSWTFDSDGGYSQGKWTRKGDRWFIKKKGILQGGGEVTATNIVTMLDDDTFTIQSVGRTLDGELLPNVNEVRVVRVQ